MGKATLNAKQAADRRVIDAKFVRAGHRPENTACDHAHYNSRRHGRYCTCGTCMWDLPGTEKWSR